MHEQQRERGNAPAFHDWEKLVLFSYWLEFRTLSVSWLVKLTFEVFDQSQNVHDLVQDGVKYLCLERVFCSCPRGLSCAVGLWNYAVFPSSFPYLWEACEGLGGAVCYSATCFVSSVEINTWRHPTPCGYELNEEIFILYACHVVL